AIGIAGRRAQDRDPALSRAPARRGRRSHGLCQPRRSRTAPGCDADRDAPARPRDFVRRPQGADAVSAIGHRRVRPDYRLTQSTSPVPASTAISIYRPDVSRPWMYHLSPSNWVWDTVVRPTPVATTRACSIETRPPVSYAIACVCA